MSEEFFKACKSFCIIEKNIEEMYSFVSIFLFYSLFFKVKILRETRGSIPGHFIPKTQKMVFDASLLNTQVQI